MVVHVVRQTLSPARLIRPLMIMLMAFYIGYHTFHGDHGLYALVREQRELATLKTDLAKTTTAREKMELRVSHLRDDALDRDLLDEQMRRMLGVMKKEELVMLVDPKRP